MYGLKRGYKSFIGRLQSFTGLLGGSWVVLSGVIIGRATIVICPTCITGLITLLRTTPKPEPYRTLKGTLKGTLTESPLIFTHEPPSRAP